MNESISHQQIFNFPTEEELNNPTNLKDVQQRIQDVVMVLSDFKKLRQPDRYDYLLYFTIYFINIFIFLMILHNNYYDLF